jgi:hypothetical protein
MLSGAKRLSAASAIHAKPFEPVVARFDATDFTAINESKKFKVLMAAWPVPRPGSSAIARR